MEYYQQAGPLEASAALPPTLVLASEYIIYSDGRPSLLTNT